MTIHQSQHIRKIEEKKTIIFCIIGIVIEVATGIEYFMNHLTEVGILFYIGTSFWLVYLIVAWVKIILKELTSMVQCLQKLIEALRNIRHYKSQ